MKQARLAHDSKWVYAAALLMALTPSFIKLICYRSYIGSDDTYIHLQVARNVPIAAMTLNRCPTCED